MQIIKSFLVILSCFSIATLSAVSSSATITSTGTAASSTASSGHNQIVDGIVRARFTQFTLWQETAASSDLSAFSAFTQSFGSVVNDIYIDFYSEVSKIRSDSSSMATASSDVISKFNAISGERAYSSQISQFMKKAGVSASAGSSSDGSSSSSIAAGCASVYVSPSILVALVGYLAFL